MTRWMTRSHSRIVAASSAAIVNQRMEGELDQRDACHNV
jgi:hypothetical protein